MIALVKQNVNNVHVYNEKGNLIFSKVGSLIGYTNNTISISTNGRSIITYDAAGKFLFGK